MKRSRTNPIVAAIIATLLAGTAAPLFADRDQRDQKWEQKEERKYDRKTDQTPPKVYKRDARQPSQPRVIERDRRTAPPRGYVLDKRYNHNHYYPRSGYRVPRLPSGYRVLRYRDRPYYYYGGTWYLHSGAYFTVTLPPVGITVPILPPFYTTIWVGGVPYYYANGAYYLWHPAQRVYVVTDPPPAGAVNEQPTEPKKLFIYPKQGQSAEQQAKDRYQCHAWAIDQTGFDPTRAGGGVSVELYVSKRDDYDRAMKACLEARGYSVK